MTEDNLLDGGEAGGKPKTFLEQLRLLNSHGAEFWNAPRPPSLARLQPVGCSFREGDHQGHRTSCEQSGNQPDDHFARARKMIPIGKGGQRDVDDYSLSRFACYLIAQNGDPRKPEIALAQKYFAIQTRRQELSDAHAADIERLQLRKQTSEEFKALSGAARDAGVQSAMFGVFHDAGYRGLYGGMGSRGRSSGRKSASCRSRTCWTAWTAPNWPPINSA